MDSKRFMFSPSFSPEFSPNPGFKSIISAIPSLDLNSCLECKGSGVELELIKNSDASDEYNIEEKDIDVVKQVYRLNKNGEEIARLSLITATLFPSTVLNWKCSIRVVEGMIEKLKSVCNPRINIFRDEFIYYGTHDGPGEQHMFIDFNSKSFDMSFDEFIYGMIPEIEEVTLI
jgi:hypothetical protein